MRIIIRPLLFHLKSCTVTMTVRLFVCRQHLLLSCCLPHHLFVVQNVLVRDRTQTFHVRSTTRHILLSRTGWVYGIHGRR